MYVSWEHVQPCCDICSKAVWLKPELSSHISLRLPVALDFVRLELCFHVGCKRRVLNLAEALPSTYNVPILTCNTVVFLAWPVGCPFAAVGEDVGKCCSARFFIPKTRAAAR